MTPAVDQALEQIRDNYGVPARLGTKVVVNGKIGEIISAKNSYISVRLKGETKGTLCHPTWKIKYLKEDV